MKLAFLLPLVAGVAAAPTANLTAPPVNEQPVYPSDPWAICQVRYMNTRGWESTPWAIQGKNWDREKLGSHGNGLLDNLRGCGYVQRWTFVTEQDPWHAHGAFNWEHKPPWCVEAAIRAAGGPNNSYCFSSIDPYGLFPVDDIRISA